MTVTVVDLAGDPLQVTDITNPGITPGVLVVAGPPGPPGPAGAGVVIRVNDYGTPQLALNAAPAGARIVFQGSYALSAALTLTGDNQWIDAQGASFTMSTWATPVFDAIGRSGCLFDLGTITYTGTRGTHTGASIRGQSPYSSGCAVWINRDRNNVRSGRVIGMPAGAACFSSWDGTGSYDRQGVGNKLGVGGSVEVSGYDFGVLPIWQKDLTIQNLYAHDDIDDSSGANPTHSVYVSPTSTAHSSGITISNVRTVNNLFGQPIQVKYTDGLVLDNISADNCKGLVNLQDCVDVEIGTMVGTNSLANGGQGAFTTAHTTLVCKKIRASLISIQLASGNDERAVSFWADDSEISALHIETNHSGSVNTALNTVVLRGDRSQIRSSSIRSLGSHMRGYVIGFGATLANDWVIDDPIIRGPRALLDVVGGSLRNKVRFDPVIQIYTGTAAPISVTGTPVGGEIIIETPNPSLDVRAYGAVGDNVATDTTAFSNAIAAAVAMKRPLWLSGGHYKLPGGLGTLPDGLIMRGAGQTPTNGTPTRLNFTGIASGTAGIVINGGSNITLSDFYITGRASGTADEISVIGQSRAVVIERITVNTATTGSAFGLATTGGGSHNLIKSSIRNCTAVGGAYGFRVGNSSTSIGFEECYANACTTAGYLIQSTYCTFKSCASDTNGLYGYLVQDAVGITFLSCGAETNGRSGWHCTNAKNITGITCRGVSNNTSANAALPSFMGINDGSNYIALIGCVDTTPNAASTSAVSNWQGTVPTELDFINNDFTAKGIHSSLRYRSTGVPSFNVRDPRYGAIGDWSSGTTGTDDLAAINATLSIAAATVAAGASAARVLFPGTLGNGYKHSDTITVPDGVEVDIRSPLVYTGPTGRPALIIGGSNVQSGREHTIRMKRYTLTDWTSETDEGLRLRNLESCKINIVQCDNFTLGVTCLGDNSHGFVYNKLYIGQLIDNKIMVDFTNDTAGWCNENQLYGGKLSNSSGTFTSMDRFGWRITSRATTKYYNNGNTWYSPSFELKGAAIAGNGYPMLVEYGSFNEAKAARAESNSPEMPRQQNDSAGNWMTFQYSDAGANAPVFSLEGNSSAGGVATKQTADVERSRRLIYKADNLHKKACYYDGGTSVNVPGLTVGTSATGNTDARAASSLTLNANYLEIPTTRYAGFYMSTRTLKRFAVNRDCEAGFGGRIIIRAYDSGGSILSAANTVITARVASNPSFTTAYGGAWQLGSDSNDPFFFAVSAATDYVFIGIVGGTATARVRAFSVSTHELTNPATWLAFEDHGFNYATTSPTSGTWEVGRMLYNAAPGAIIGWVCTAAGTPGTWQAINSGQAPQIDSLTSASGTWNKPTGAVRHVLKLQAGGGGAGSGRRGATSTVRTGGGGGGGGGYTEVEVPTSELAASIAYTIGAAGTGGAAVTADDTNGNPGTSGGNVTFGAYRAYGGIGGSGGTTAAAAGGTGNAGTSLGGSGAASSGTGGVGGNSTPAAGAPGGAGGGGITSGNAAANGGLGGTPWTQPITGNGPAGGVVDTTTPVNGGNFTTGQAGPGASAGGGAASITTAAQAGANGGNYGAGGGGGGASLNGNNSGKGGDGGSAIAEIITYFQ
jgi:hypothetical protein